MKKNKNWTETDKNWIKKWLNECERYNINPWEWDFKSSYINDVPIKYEYLSEGIEMMLRYKGYMLNEKSALNVSNATGENGDADKEAYYIYRVLFHMDQNGIIRGETMNSFITTFNRCIYLSENKKNIYEDMEYEYKTDKSQYYKLLLENRNYLKFDIVKKNLESIEKFSRLTHTLGNFTVLPYWMNTGRYTFSKDYWDITLQSLKDFIQPFGDFNKFVDLYYYDRYVTEELDVIEFWDEHFLKGPSLTSEEDVGMFLNFVNLAIEQRGKLLTKILCDELELTDYWFYNELKND